MTAALSAPLPRTFAKMASLWTALRAAPHAQLIRPTASTRIAPLVQRSYASAPPATRRPADDTKSAEQAEQASEDLAGEDDPNMVSTAVYKL